MFKTLINLFYPVLCTGCGEPLVTGQEVVCTACRLQLPYLFDKIDDNNPVARVFWGRVNFEFAGALFYFQKNSIVQSILHEFKYKNRIEIADVFGKEIGKLIIKSDKMNYFDALVPVPLHPKKLRKRGYNQSELLANAIAQTVNKPVLTKVLSKKEFTETQTHKNRTDRWKNTAEKFVLESTNIPQKILLIDDVITTGATLDVCASLLHQHNPECKISAFSLAYSYR